MMAIVEPQQESRKLTATIEHGMLGEYVCVRDVLTGLPIANVIEASIDTRVDAVSILTCKVQLLE